MERKAAPPAASAGRGKKRQNTRSAALDEPLPKPGCPPHCRFRRYYALFIDYAAAVVGATRETPNLEITVAQSSHSAEDENENGGEERVEVEEEEEGMWGWAAEAGEELHRCGSYGKGTLSRSQPTFGRSRPPTASARHRTLSIHQHTIPCRGPRTTVADGRLQTYKEEEEEGSEQNRCRRRAKTIGPSASVLVSTEGATSPLQGLTSALPLPPCMALASPKGHVVFTLCVSCLSEDSDAKRPPERFHPMSWQLVVCRRHQVPFDGLTPRETGRGTNIEAGGTYRRHAPTCKWTRTNASCSGWPERVTTWIATPR